MSSIEKDRTPTKISQFSTQQLCDILYQAPHVNVALSFSGTVHVLIARPEKMSFNQEDLAERVVQLIHKQSWKNLSSKEFVQREWLMRKVHRYYGMSDEQATNANFFTRAIYHLHKWRDLFSLYEMCNSEVKKTNFFTQSIFYFRKWLNSSQRFQLWPMVPNARSSIYLMHKGPASIPKSVLDENTIFRDFVNNYPPKTFAPETGAHYTSQEIDDIYSRLNSK